MTPTLSALALGLALSVGLVSYVAIARTSLGEARELAWTLIPAALLLTLFIWSALR